MKREDSQVGLIGLGYMGSAMAKRLRERGRTPIGFDIDETKMKTLAERGMTCVGSPAEAARDTEAVIVCVTSTTAVEQAVFGSEGVAEAGRRGQILVDMSTTDAEATRRMAERLGPPRWRLEPAPPVSPPLDLRAPPRFLARYRYIPPSSGPDPFRRPARGAPCRSRPGRFARNSCASSRSVVIGAWRARRSCRSPIRP